MQPVVRTPRFTPQRRLLNGMQRSKFTTQVLYSKTPFFERMFSFALGIASGGQSIQASLHIRFGFAQSAIGRFDLPGEFPNVTPDIGTQRSLVLVIELVQARA